ncbi:electron transfer flavoprotein subunit beta/FixA family protein [Corynebacterium aquatimens]|uniref:Electron transfer flavoprotein subunit beta n=1 Tax=Corynebacterium aquatimens TaxID=1190508 RepID=A0A931GSK5_9CORY|nr:electron transfer flavoprotein subunit beta/FixA family protein [Corynebacterium aquatimens]MBG6122157.1 electron transfer flavoprotein beta subunit [Corynebacterium aquatimens]WJY65302.1 Electron transfer flavoprotein subunit beta [Corynebacterium aquatimens]
MRIAVLLKEVPDTYGDREIDLETGLADRSGDVVADEIGERAVEAALAIASANNGEVEILSVGPASISGSIRKGLAMGATSAHIATDDGLIGADLTLTAEVLAAMIKANGYDLVVAGNLSTDGNAGMIPAMVAELLDWPALTNLTEVTVAGDNVTATRASDTATVGLEAQLPAVISVTEHFPDPRYPNFKGLMAAKKKPLNTVALADLGIDPEDFSHARSIMIDIAERPAREAGTIIHDDGTAAEQLADFLAANRLI